MGYGAITGYIDVAQVVLYIFWGFFAGLIYYLHRENKREGYPLESDVSARHVVEGFPRTPQSKTFRLVTGRLIYSPRPDEQWLDLSRFKGGRNWNGDPIDPVGINPMVQAIGPASFAERHDAPDLTWDGQVPKVVPLRHANDYHLDDQDPDPRGMQVFGADGVVAGTVVDVWIDRSEVICRYLEVDVLAEFGGGRALVPMTMMTINYGPFKRVKVESITAAQFRDVPGTKHSEQVTLREEDQIMGYFGGGTLYATPDRAEPLL